MIRPSYARALLASLLLLIIAVASAFFALRAEPAQAWEGDYSSDGNLYNNAEQYSIVVSRDWLKACKEAAGSIESRENFCRSLPVWWTGTRARCWAHVHSGWLGWCDEEFGSPW